MITKLLLVSGIFLGGSQGFALTLDYDLTTSLYQSGGGIWNASDGRIEPQIQVKTYSVDGLTNSNYNIELGSGAHGSFNLQTYALFDQDGDVSSGIIEIDTSIYTELLFLDFHLEPTYTIRPVGGQPLVIRVIGSVLIEGVIDCSGTNGEDISDSETNLARGGTGYCGGGDGGDGGSLNSLPKAGLSGGASISGGQPGSHLEPAGGHGGGGGGGYNESGGARDPTDGLDELMNPTGNKGTSLQDRALTELGGGSGGGGGGAFDQGLITDSNGGGGGGGGGVIYIYSKGDVEISGQVLADGGRGGRDTTGLRGGGGGGGAGGSILIFSGGFVTISGVVSAQAGGAGTTTAGDGGDGGKGAEGRTWITDFDFSSDCTCETPQSYLNSLGFIRPLIGESEVISVTIDTGNSFPLITSGSLVTSGGGASSSASLKVAMGATSNFTPVVWEDVNSVTQASARYLKFKVSIDNQSSANPMYVNGVTININEYKEKDFSFSGGCGLVKGSGYPGWSILFLVLPLLLGLYLRWQTKMTYIFTTQSQK